MALRFLCHEMIDGKPLSPSPYCVYDTNLTSCCPLHVASPVSIFVIIGYFGQLVKGNVISLVSRERARHDGFPKTLLFPLIDCHVNVNVEI